MPAAEAEAAAASAADAAAADAAGAQAAAAAAAEAAAVLNVARMYVHVCSGMVGSDREAGHAQHNGVAHVYDVRGVLGIGMANALRVWAWSSPTRIM